MTMDGCKHLIVASTGGVYRINTENYDREVWNDNPGVFPTLIKARQSHEPAVDRNDV